jgi:predicted outer membrane repeat protein
VPLIAHDRACFGGAICTTGIIVLFAVWCGEPSKSLWQVLTFAGAVGFAAAIGVHPAIGYVDMVHLAPAIIGALTFTAGVALSYRGMMAAGRTS